MLSVLLLCRCKRSHSLSACTCLPLSLHVSPSQLARVSLSACTCLPLSLHVSPSQLARVSLSACTCLPLSLHVSPSQLARVFLSACTCLHGTCDNGVTGKGACKPNSCQSGYHGDNCDQQNKPCQGGTGLSCHIHASCALIDGVNQ